MNESQTVKELELSGLPRRQLAVFLLIRFVLNVNNRMVYPFISQFASGLNVTTAAVSSGLSIRSFLTIIDPFIASLSDRYGRKPVALLCLLLILSGFGVFLLHPCFFTFVIYICLGYCGTFAAMSAIQAYIADCESTEKANRHISIMELGWSTSFLVGMPLIAILISHFQWKAPLYVLGVIILAVTIILGFTMQSPRPDFCRNTDSQKPHFLAHIGSVFQSRSVIQTFLLFFAIMIPSELVLVSFSSWLENAFQMEILSLGMSSFFIGFAELTGEGLAIALANRLRTNRKLTIGILGNALFACLIPILGQTSAGAVIALFFFFITTEFVYISAIPITVEVMPSARAAILGINCAVIALSRALSDLIGPYVLQVGLWCVVMVVLIADVAAFFEVKRLSRSLWS